MTEHSTLIRKIRVWVPILFILLQAAAFLIIYSNTLGWIISPILPHLTIVLLWSLTIYGCAAASSQIKWHPLRTIILCLLGFSTVIVTTLFYLVELFCLYGFRDILTLSIVHAYFDQIPSMLFNLPFDRVTIFLGLSLFLISLISLSVFLAWCLAEIANNNSRANTQHFRPQFAIIPMALLLLLIAPPATGFVTSLEPWSRGLHDRPISDSGLILKADPAEAARDTALRAQYPTTPQGRRLNVILIYVDALRADVLQPYGADLPDMPFMTTLVETHQVTQFPRVFASCSMTLCGVGSLLQSRAAHKIDPKNFSLPDLLQIQGYQTRYLLSGNHQHFLTLKQYYGKPDFYLDGFDIDPKHANDDLIAFRELKKLPPSAATKQPQFIMLSLMSAHIWGQRYPQFRYRLPDRITTTSFSNLDTNSAQIYRNNYLNGVRQSDYVLKEIWEFLKASGYLKNSIIVITADHGELLGENGHLGHARSLSTPELLIPLWIHDPTGQIAPRDVAFQEDIAPTILDILQLPKPESWIGRSLLLPLPQRRWHSLYYINSRNLFGLILSDNHHIFKYLVDTKRGRESAYDLNTDLTDRNDILQSMPRDMLKEFREKLQEVFGNFPSTYQTLQPLSTKR